MPSCSTSTDSTGQRSHGETLRVFPLARLLEEGRKRVLRYTDEQGRHFNVGAGPAPAARDAFQTQLARETAVKRPTGRRAKSDDELERIAEEYLAAGSQPIKALKALHPNYSESNIKKWVAQARERGFLPPAKYERRNRKEEGNA